MKPVLIFIIACQALWSIQLSGRLNELIDNRDQVINELESGIIDKDIQIKKEQAISVKLLQELLAKTKQNTLAIKESPKKYDFVLSEKKWQCTEKASVFKWSTQEYAAGVNQYWVGKARECVRFERIGST